MPKLKYILPIKKTKLNRIDSHAPDQLINIPFV